VNAQADNGETSLWGAVQSKNCEIVQTLVDRGADATISLENGNTPLHYAAKYSTPQMIELLASRASEVNHLIGIEQQR
jgi:ankyrin repeat protein